MKKTIYISLLLIFISNIALSQKNKKIGGGYFGNTVTYPGLVFEYELEYMFTEKVSIPIRFDAGFYIHPRYNNGIFANINFGFRRYFDSGLFLEESIGAGLISTFVNSDAVYSVDINGNVTETSGYAATDLMPLINLGIGYNLGKSTETKKLIWIRPGMFWQYPHKTSSMYSPSVQLGYTMQIK